MLPCAAVASVAAAACSARGATGPARRHETARSLTPLDAADTTGFLSPANVIDRPLVQEQGRGARIVSDLGMPLGRVVSASSPQPSAAQPPGPQTGWRSTWRLLPCAVLDPSGWRAALIRHAAALAAPMTPQLQLWWRAPPSAALLGGRGTRGWLDLGGAQRCPWHAAVVALKGSAATRRGPLVRVASIRVARSVASAGTPPSLPRIGRHTRREASGARGFALSAESEKHQNTGKP